MSDKTPLRHKVVENIKISVERKQSREKMSIFHINDMQDKTMGLVRHFEFFCNNKTRQQCTDWLKCSTVS